MKRYRSALTSVTSAAAATLGLALLAGCGTDAAPESEGDAGQTRTVSHVYGETEIPVDPQNVVSVSVTSTAALLSLDVPVVASSTTSPGPLTDDNGFFSQWAEIAVERGVEPLSEVAPTVVYGESDTPWTELTDQYAEAFDSRDRAEEIHAEYAELIEETAAALSSEHDVTVLTQTPEGFNVFTAESAQGRLLDELGLTLHEMPDDLTASGTQGGAQRSDIVQLSPERASDFGDSTLLFVNLQGQEVEDYTEAAPTLNNLPAYEEGRAYTLGAEAFRLDYYSVPLITDRLVEILG